MEKYRKTWRATRTPKSGSLLKHAGQVYISNRGRLLGFETGTKTRHKRHSQPSSPRKTTVRRHLNQKLHDRVIRTAKKFHDIVKYDEKSSKYILTGRSCRDLFVFLLSLFFSVALSVELS